MASDDPIPILTTDDARRAKPALIVHDDPAFNAETPVGLLDGDTTPNDLFFVRNNGDLPPFDPVAARAWRLTIDGDVEAPLTLSLDDLRRDFDVVELTAVLECAGNGRARFEPPTDGVPWGDGAVGCARWTGVRLADLLARARPKPTAIYTAHHAPDLASDHAGPAISRGIPLDKALRPETLIAFAMNGEALPFLHGAPLRLVVPGYPGSAWQKWLTRLTLRDREHDGAKMTGTDYRLPRRRYEPGEPIDERDFEVITEMPAKAMITSALCVQNGAERVIDVRGRAWSGGAPVERVDVSVDNGRTWTRASMEPPTERWGWRRFVVSLVGSYSHAREAIARATDAAGRTQPLMSEPWNPRGYVNRGCHRFKIIT